MLSDSFILLKPRVLVFHMKDMNETFLRSVPLKAETGDTCFCFLSSHFLLSSDSFSNLVFCRSLGASELLCVPACFQPLSS